MSRSTHEKSGYAEGFGEGSLIGRLRGVIEQMGDHWALVDVNGVGYRVICSSRTLAQFNIGDIATIEVETHVREDHINLYGFIDSIERDWFKLLTTVQGVGAKVGLAVLSVIEPDELTRIVAAADNDAVSRAPGVGPKLAKRIVSELKDKVGAIALKPPGDTSLVGGSDIFQGAQLPDAITEAASALVNLGYGPSEALAAVSRVAGEHGDNVLVEALIRDGLRELAPAYVRTEG